MLSQLFIVVPALIVLFLISLVAGSVNYLSKDDESIFFFNRPTKLDKAWFVSNLIVLSFFI